jgi:hypothetical protein
MTVVISHSGQVRCLYAEGIELATLGPSTINRASHVEPDSDGQWWADLAPIRGPKLGPFSRRSQALEAETAWLESHWLVPEEG